MPLPRTPVQRIFAAIALSALLHALLLWLPDIRLPTSDAPLPLLTAKLITLPKHPPKPRHRTAEHPHTPSPRPLEATPAIPLPASSVDIASASLPTDALLAESAVLAASEVVAQSATAVADNYALSSDHAPALPRHAQLLFVAYLGTHGLYLGEIRHRLETTAGHYTLHAETETNGLVRLLKRFSTIQDSRGTLLTPGGLRPDEFSEVKSNSGEVTRSIARFDWDTHEISFAAGNKTRLPEGAQDILSFLYQLSQLPYELENLPLAISNGRKLERYRLEVVGEEDIYTPMGKLHTLHLRKLRDPDEEGAEIWLGLEYRLLPVKFRHIDRNGDISGEIAIKEIRIADE